MRNRSRLARCLVACAAALPVVGTAGEFRFDQRGNAYGASMAGVWVADMSASKLSPALPMRDALIQIAVDEKSVTISSDIVDGSGRQQRGSETVPTTGGLSSGTLTEGVTHRARWLDEDVLAVPGQERRHGLPDRDLRAVERRPSTDSPLDGNSRADRGLSPQRLGRPPNDRVSGGMEG